MHEGEKEKQSKIYKWREENLGDCDSCLTYLIHIEKNPFSSVHFSCSIVSNSVTPRTTAHQAPLPLEFPMQEYWSGVLFHPPEDLPNTDIRPMSLVSPVLAGGFFTTSASFQFGSVQSHNHVQLFVTP